MYSTGNNVEKSLKLAWKHKILWVVALLLVGGTSSMNNLSNITDDLDDIDRFKKPDVEIQNNINTETNININSSNNPQEIMNRLENRVKGVSDTSVTPQPSLSNSNQDRPIKGFANLLGLGKNWIVFVIFAVPAYLVLFLYGIFSGIMTVSWAKGALVKQTLETIKNKDNPKLAKMAKFGVSNIKNLFILSLIYFLIILLTIIPTVLVTVLIAAIFQDSTATTISGIVLGLLYIGVIIIVGLSQGFAYREVVNGATPKEALKAAINLLGMSLGDVLKLVVANIGFTLLSVVALGIGSLTSLITLIFAPIVIILLVQAIGGFMGTYKNFAWSNLYLYAKSKK